MSFPKLSVSRPAGTSIIYISLIVLAVYSSFLIPVDLLPPVETPFVSVAISYPGASPEQIETLIVRPMEDELKVVEGVEEIQSTCEDGVGLIQIKFRTGENLDFAVQRVNERVEFVKRRLLALQSGGTNQFQNLQISVLRFTSSAFPILFIGVVGKRTLESLYQIAYDLISPYISTIPGVGGTLILADAQRNLNIWLDVSKMQKYGIGVQEVRSAIYQYNGDFSVGKINIGDTAFFSTVKGKLGSLRDVEDIVVSVKNGLPIRLKDIADIEISSKLESSRSIFFDESGVEQSILLMLVRKRSGSSIVQTSDRIKDELSKISERLPADVKVLILLDFADQIRETINELRRTIFYAVLSVLVITYLFIRNFGESFILFTSIPVSVLFSVLFLYLLGKSFNIISLSAIIVSTGVVIDNSIVVLESIKRKQREGLPLIRAIVEGAEYVFTALLASTITNFVPFIPIIFLKGFTLSLFSDFALVVFLSSLISLIVAVTLIPALSSKVMKEEKFTYPFEWLESGYKRFLGFVINKPVVPSLAIIFLSVSIFLLFPTLKKEIFPVRPAPDLRVFIYLPKVANSMWSERVAFQIKDEIIKIFGDNILYVFLRYGESTFGRAFGRAQRFTEADNLILVGIRLRSSYPYNLAYEKISQLLSSFPDIENFRILPANPINILVFAQQRNVQLLLYSDTESADYVKFVELAKRIRDDVRTLDFVRAADVDIEEPVPEIKLALWDYAKSLGVTPLYLGDYLSTLITGSYVGPFSWNGQNINIFLVNRYGRNIGFENFLRLPIKPPFSQDGTVFLGDIVVRKFGVSPSEILRVNGIRAVSLSVDTTGATLTDAEKLKRYIEDNYPEVFVDLGGAVRETSSTFKSAIIIFILAIFLVYSSMVVILESLSLPLIILLNIPLGIAGVVLALFLTKIPLSILGIIAIFLLSGIVVNNGIVLIEVVNKKEREEGLDWRSALRDGAGSRIRPVLMTSLTTIFGLVPSLFIQSKSLLGGSDFVIPSVGGLAFSLLMTLVLIPSLYATIRRIKERYF